VEQALFLGYDRAASWRGLHVKPLAAEAMSQLIGSIYDCAIEPERWPDTLERLRLELEFANASLSMLAMPSGAILLNIVKGPDPYWLDRVGLYGPDVVDQWGGAEKMQTLPLGEPLVLSHIRPRSEWANNRFFREWARPQGLHDVMAIGLTRDSSMVSSIGMGRHDSAGEITDLEIAAAGLLIPHLRRAVTINRLLDLKSVEAATFASTIDTLAVAIVLTDAELRIIHANAAADAMLRVGDPVTCRGGMLCAREPVAAALASAVRLAANDEATLGKRGLGIPVQRNSGEPCVLHVLPLARSLLRAGLVPAAMAAIFVAPATSPAPPPADAAAALFDLTPSEARVFGHIASGLTQTETANALGVRASTVKTHLLNVFAKTGTSRQAELVRLAASLTLPLLS
jgi:DNA-binding CsgD family transcriptional regulator